MREVVRDLVRALVVLRRLDRPAEDAAVEAAAKEVDGGCDVLGPCH